MESTPGGDAMKVAEVTTKNWEYVNLVALKKNKEPLDESERGEGKSWLKTQLSKNEDRGIWPYHFMANRETMETLTDFIFGALGKPQF